MKRSVLNSFRFAALFFIAMASSSVARELSEMELDGFVKAAMNKFNVPGIAVGVVQDNEIKLLKGYGVREIGKPAPVDGDTMYAIASNSKAFTAAALAILVDDGVLHWDDKVIDFLPDFRMMDPWITADFTIRDLLTHRSGMGLGAGDLMFWPTTERTRAEIIRNVRYLKMVTGFRSAYAYDNTLYVVAGEVIAAASGMSYEQFVQTRIMNQLAIGNGCRADITTITDKDNVATPHTSVDGKLQIASRLNEPGQPMVIAAAGGIQCSARDMLKWMNVHLHNGAGLMSKAQHDEMWSPQTIQPVSMSDHNWFGTNFAAYGLGFRLKDYYGYKQVSHTGGLLGMVTYEVMIPEKNLGVVVLTNQENGYAMRAIMENIMQVYLDQGDIDWTERYAQIEEREIEKADSEVAKDEAEADAKALLPLSDYVGLYRDPWFGDVRISIKDGGLYFTAMRSRKLKGPLSAFKFNTFKAIWEDRSFKADAYAMFSTDFEGRVNGLKMKAISPLTDFSYDFHDLDFTKVED
ncbi:MAG: serine hydrolase [Emcibacteraceae bacterium]